MANFDTPFPAKVGLSKQDKLDMSNTIKTQTLKEVAGGSPRGKFANIEELRRAYPNGDVGVYLTEDNGYWNFYDTKTRQWTEGGSYIGEIEGKQDLLESGVNIKTINGNSILGGGNLEISGSGTGTEVNANTGIDTDIPLEDIKIGSGVYDLKKTYATKKDLNAPVEIPTYCDDRVEITGHTGCSKDLSIDVKGIPEQLIKIPTIKGRTERVSENLFEIIAVEYTIANVNVKSNQDTASISYNGSSNEAGGGRLNKLTKDITLYPSKYSMIIYGNIGGMIPYIQKTADNSILKSNFFDKNGIGVYVFDILEETKVYLGVNIKSNFNFNNQQIYPALYKGDYSNKSIPPFKPYNDNLVNSNNILVSTGKQLNDEIWESGELLNGIPQPNTNKIRNRNFNRLIAKSFITIANYNNKGSTLYLYDNDKKFIDTWSCRANSYRSIDLGLTPTACYYKIVIDDTKDIVGQIENVYYGKLSSKPNYEPYKDNRIVRCGELGQWDYIDNVNNKKHIKTSEIIILDGSSDETYEKYGTGQTGVYRYFLENKSISTPFSPNSVNTISNYFDLSFNDQNQGKIGVSTNSGGTLISVSSTIERVEQFKTWLKSNPIKLVYRLETETIEDIIPPLQDTMAVAIGGMQYQRPVDLIENPVYDITKIYYSSIQGQINANIQTDVEQQKEIDDLIVENNRLKQQINEVSMIPSDNFDEGIFKNDGTLQTYTPNDNGYVAITYQGDATTIRLSLVNIGLEQIITQAGVGTSALYIPCRNGDTIQFTTNGVVATSLVSKFIHSKKVGA